ncbi:MAG: hypothetical protein E3J56_02420 [Candidatus Aminicenantes bacterium]|nr:MAG: hypothetical protein E3J56_02420 [Candidatus Aminicenantes bacterium]
MKTKNLIISVFILGFVFTLVLSPSIDFAQDEKIEKEKAEEKFTIPPEVKLVLAQGLTQRQGRQDIPFLIIKHLYLPAQENIHSIFLFKMKNASLGFASQAFALVEKKPEKEKTVKKEEKEKKETAEEETPPAAQTETPPIRLRANLNVFLQFHRLEKKEPVEVFKEVYIPLDLQAESTSYNPEKEEVYSTAYPLPPGNYLMAMAITSIDLHKIGTLYYEFSLPDMKSFTENLDTTPIFFAQEIKRMASPELTAEVHKDFFTFSVLQVEPKIENIFSPGENLDIFYFIFGAQPNEEGNYDIEVNYEVLKEEESVIRFESQTYNFPFISQLLPMKRAVTMKSKDEEKQEKKDLEPGIYTFSLKIKDNVTGKTLDKSIDFEIK